MKYILVVLIASLSVMSDGINFHKIQEIKLAHEEEGTLTSVNPDFSLVKEFEVKDDVKCLKELVAVGEDVALLAFAIIS